METKTKFGALVILFLGVIVVLALLPTIADRTKELSEKVQTSNETFNYSLGRNMTAGQEFEINETYVHLITHRPASNSWEQRNCPLSGFVLWLSNESLILNTHYTINLSNGTMFLLNHTMLINATSNRTYANYTWCDEGYIAQGAGRTVAQLVLIFSAIGLLAWAIYTGIKEWL